MLHVPNKTEKTKQSASQPGLFLAAFTNEVRRVKAWLEERIRRAAKLPPETLFSEVFVITPAMAEYILNHHNTGNRPIRASRVAEYARRINEGEWRVTHQGVSFARNGNLNNGQHRFSAIVAAGRAVPLYFTFGEERDVFPALDEHGVRGAADAVTIAGIRYGSVVSSAARLLMSIERGWLSGKGKLSNEAILRFAQAHPGLEIIAQNGSAVAKKCLCSSAAMTAALYLIVRDTKDNKRVDWFVDRLIDGAGLEAGSPILKLRDGLQKRTIDKDFRDGHGRAIAQVAATVKTWNMVRRNRRGAVAWNPNTPFPVAE